MKCADCLFHVPGPDHCRRNPPTPTNATNSTFPVVDKSWWCGHHKAATAKQMKFKATKEAEYQKMIKEAQAEGRGA